MSMSSREIIRLIELTGWEHHDTRGSHWQFVHLSRPGRVAVPHPKRDLATGLVRSIEKQSGVTLRRLQ